MKKTSKLVMVIVFISVIYFIGHRIYSTEFSNKGILENAINRDGYMLELVQEHMPIEFYIEPDMIPNNIGEKKNIVQPLLEVNNTLIILDNVWNRANDIYFSFTTTYRMNFFKGEFLYNNVFHEDGSVTAPSSGEFKIFDNEGNEIQNGGTGTGPNADFSFAIRHEDQNKIENGVYVKYTGYILYKYKRK